MGIVDKIQFGTKIEVEVLEGWDRRNGQTVESKVMRYLASRYGDRCFCDVCFGKINWTPEAIKEESRFVVEETKIKGETVVRPAKLQGKLLNRLSKYVFLRMDIELNDADRQTLGKIIADPDKPQPELVDFTKKLNWRSGDFGDGGSCFWCGREGARAMIESDGGFAMRFWDGNTGRGRCWILQVDDDHIMLFNAYDRKTHSNPLEYMARVLAHHLGDCEWKPVSFSNNGDRYGMLYTNAGGIVVGPNAKKFTVVQKHIPNMNHYPYPVHAQGKGYECSECHDHFGGDPMQFGGENFCPGCFEDLVSECDYCHENVWNDDLTNVYRGSRIINYCPHCLEKHAGYKNGSYYAEE